MDQNTIISFIQNVGFPIGISVYLLVRMEKKIDELTKSIKDLSENNRETARNNELFLDIYKKGGI